MTLGQYEIICMTLSDLKGLKFKDISVEGEYQIQNIIFFNTQPKYKEGLDKTL